VAAKEAKEPTLAKLNPRWFIEKKVIIVVVVVVVVGVGVKAVES